MILYEVRQGVVTVMSVKKETKCGWRQHNNGFINRKVVGKYLHLNDSFYTTNLLEAKEWAGKMRDRMHDLIQVSHASICDIEVWEDNGSIEDNVPKSRFSIN